MKSESEFFLNEEAHQMGDCGLPNDDEGAEGTSRRK